LPAGYAAHLTGCPRRLKLTPCRRPTKIYVICGYSEDRMLRGITRPTARITASLQAEKILPASVTPIMKPVYVDAGALTAIRIPSEVVDILNESARVPAADLVSRV
jgi:hypothetical protein